MIPPINPLPSKLIVPWKRFWCPLGASIQCGYTGREFLTDPEEDFGKYQNPNVFALETIVPETGPLILCGEPGMGKTTEFEKLRDQLQDAKVADAGPVLSLSCRSDIFEMEDFRRIVEEGDDWRRWKSGEGRFTLMIDGVDEGLLRISDFVGRLTRFLRDEPCNRLRLVLTCRSAEWPTLQGDELLSLWNQPHGTRKPVFELCPLRQKDAAIFAREHGCQEKLFISALWEMNVVGLATRPVTLKFLVDEFKTKEKFPETHRQLFERGVEKLAAEVNPGRRESVRALSRREHRPSLPERLAAAQRIAAVFLCCGKSAVCRDGEITPGSNSVLLTECLGESSAISDLALNDVLESALFTSIGEDRFAFSHQTFAECLAAQHLKVVPVVQLRKLLLQRDDEGEHVIPQLMELAAWVAGYHSEFCDHLLHGDPSALLRSDVSVLPFASKAALVEAILQRADADDLIDVGSLFRFFFGLWHPDLAAQLRPYITRKTHHYIARRIAIEIAERCRLQEFCDDLLRILRDAADNMREEAAEALCEIMPEERLSELEPLARGEVGADKNHAIRAVALKRLIPGHWPVRVALPHIVPEGDSHVIGSYHMFLHHGIHPHFEVDDIAPALKWLHKDPDLMSWHRLSHDLAVKVVVLALQNLDRKDVGEALVELWFSLAHEYRIERIAKHKEVSRVLTDHPRLKWQLAALIVNAASRSEEKFNLRTALDNLISFNDPINFEWLLDQVQQVEDSKKATWFDLIQSCLHWNEKSITPSWDKLLALRELEPELMIRTEWLRAWDLNEPLARGEKARWLKQKRRQARWDKHFANDEPDPRAIREDALKRIELGDADAWYHLWVGLYRGDGDPYTKSFRPIVEEYPGWPLISAQDQQLARAGARAFIIHHANSAVAWEKQRGHSYFSAIAAIWLLRDVLFDDDELRKTLHNAWIPCLASFYEYEADIAAGLFKLAHDLSPDAAARALFSVSSDDGNAKRDVPARIEKAAACWNSKLTYATLAYLRGLTNPKVIRSMAEEWSKLDRPAAQAFASDYLENSLPRDGAYPIGLYDALLLFLRTGASTVLDRIIPILAHNQPLARAVWTQFLYQGYPLREEVFQSLSDVQIADLYLHLSDVFPFDDDPPRAGGRITGDQMAVEGRDRLPGVLAARGTAKACAELRRLITLRSDLASRLKWTYLQALANKRRNSWERPTPKHFVSLFEKASRRLLQSELDLLDLVLESLDRYQRLLREGMHSPIEVLWQWNGTVKSGKNFKPRDEEVISRAIARWLMDDVGPKAGVVVNCEVQAKVGIRTDIHIDAMMANGSRESERLSLVIEVKGCWHKDVRKAIHTQLVDGYMKDLGLKVGIYLIAWFICERWQRPVNKCPAKTIREVQSWIEAEAAKDDHPPLFEKVAGFVLDCSWPCVVPSGSKRKRLARKSPRRLRRGETKKSL